MPLPLPSLDDRRWADLVDEGRALVPRYAPQWSDHNIHDPGITLIELFAWLAESAVYRLNRIPPRHLRKFLALAGIHAPGPSAARTTLTFAPIPAGAPFTVPGGVEFDIPRQDGKFARFATLRDVTLSKITLAALQLDSGDGVIRDLSGYLTEGFLIDLFGPTASLGAAAYFGFDDLPSGTPVNLGFWFEGPGHDFAERDRIEREAKAQREACTPVQPDFPCANLPPKLPLELPPPHHSVRLLWQASTGPGTWETLKHVSLPKRPATGEVTDDTRSLTLNGLVEVNAPASLAKVQIGGDITARFYIRCLLDRGGWDAPVTLRALRANAVNARQAVPFWTTFPIAAGLAPTGAVPALGQPAAIQFTLDLSGAITALSFLAPGTPGVPAFTLFAYAAPGPSTPGSITLALTMLGVGTGEPNQTFRSFSAPVDSGLRVFTHDGAAWMEWTREEDFDASSGGSRNVVIDRSSGTVGFGDGDHGRTALPGHLVLASGAHSDAENGNRAPGAMVRISAGPVNAVRLSGLTALELSTVRQTAACVFGASGGAPDRSLSQLIGEAVETLDAHENLTRLAATLGQSTLDQIEHAKVRATRTPSNAVDLLDIERIALDTPGTQIARAHAWRDLDPAFPCLRASGTVTVLVIPDMPVPNPAPTTGLLAAVGRHLDRKRIVCTRLKVVGPHYVTITIEGRITTVIGASPRRVLESVRAAIDMFLDPRAGGPDKLGWPFGRSIYRTEMLQLIDGVSGVDHVEGLTIRAGTGKPQCGDLRLCATWLPTPGQHNLEVR